ncbi:MAG: hypothetical protein JSW62_04220, partial [Thermoplasmatales archaeon]
MNRKFSAFAIIYILIIASLTLTSFIDVKISTASAENTSLLDLNKNILTPEDEGDHFPRWTEWWMFHASLELEDGTHWDASATLQYETKAGSTDVYRHVLLMYYTNRESGKCYDFSTVVYTNGSCEQSLSCKKNEVDLEYLNCTINGLYPNYTIHLEEDEQRFSLDIKLNATSLPHWAAQEGAEGYFPWGLEGLSRYFYIPKLEVSGNITTKGIKSKATGLGYFEHAWGNFTYVAGSTSRFVLDKPLLKIEEFIKNLPTFLHLIKWYLSEQTIDFSPRTLKINKDNLFGFDWAWTVFDNGWTLHFGAFYMLNFVDEGPI